MKKLSRTIFYFSVVLLFIVFSCKEETTTKPCDGYGNISFNNKTDSAVQVSISEAHNTFSVNENYIKGVKVEGDKSYKITIEGRNILRDTTLLISVCDNIDLVILK